MQSVVYKFPLRCHIRRELSELIELNALSRIPQTLIIMLMLALWIWIECGCGWITHRIAPLPYFHSLRRSFFPNSFSWRQGWSDNKTWQRHNPANYEWTLTRVRIVRQPPTRQCADHGNVRAFWLFPRKSRHLPCSLHLDQEDTLFWWMGCFLSSGTVCCRRLLFDIRFFWTPKYWSGNCFWLVYLEVETEQYEGRDK